MARIIKQKKILIPILLSLMVMLIPLMISANSNNIKIYGPFDDERERTIDVAYNSNAGFLIVSSNPQNTPIYYIISNFNRAGSGDPDCPNGHFVYTPVRLCIPAPSTIDTRDLDNISTPTRPADPIHFSIFALYPRNTILIDGRNKIHETSVFYTDASTPVYTMNMHGVPTIKHGWTEQNNPNAYASTPSDICIWPYDWNIPVIINGVKQSCIWL